jgi:SAM-dependent methyltransferase
MADSGPWDKDYGRRGILWSGVIRDLPDLALHSRVLELGCGNGKTLFAMLQRGWDVTAIDFAPEAVMLCRGFVGSKSHGHVMIADALFPPFKYNSFDAVFALHVIGHMHEAERERVIIQLTHVLKPDGVIIFSDFSRDDFRFGKGNETEPATFRRGPGILTHYFTKNEVIDLFSTFTPVSILEHQWPMRVLGSALVRSEIQAIFAKKME